MPDDRWSGTCQNCTEEFDWRNTECPHCGWNKQAWVDNGRYGSMNEARP